MANTVNETGAKYLSSLGMGGVNYTIKDAWARAELEEVKAVVAGGVQFKGVVSTPIKDGDDLKELTLSAGGTIAVSDQKDGFLFIYNNGTRNLEFVVSGGKYSEFGSTGELGALAFANTATGSATVDVAGSIAFKDYTPNVTKGTLAVTEGKATIKVESEAATASGKFTPAEITVSAKDVDFTASTNSKSSFTALTSATYDEATATLTFGTSTSDEFLTGISLVGSVAAETITQTEQDISVSYQKAKDLSQEVLTSAALSGDISVTAVAPTATITNPTISVTVSPDAV